MKPIPLFLIAILWAASLGGVYWFANHQGLAAGKDEAIRSGEVIAASGAPGSAKTVRPGGPGHAGGGGASGGVVQAPSLKQILAQVKGLLRTGGMNNPASAMKALTLLGQVRDEDLPEAIKAAEETTEPQQKMLLYMVLLGRWAEKDAPAAMKYAEENLDGKGPMLQMAKMGVISAWAEKDPNAVWDWYKKQADKDSGGGMFGGKTMALMGIFNSMAGQDTELAFKRYHDLETPEERQMALMGISQSAYDDDSRQRVLTEIKNIPDADERKNAARTLVGQWAMLDPDKAVAYVDSLPADERHDLAQNIGSMMMMSDPKKGAEFLLKNSDEKNRGQAYDTVVSMWANQDPNAAGAWLGTQPQGPELDGARATFAVIAAKRDGESAMEWAKTITNDTQRETSVGQVYQTWHKKDAAAADTALQNSGFTPEKVEVIKATAAAAGNKPVGTAVGDVATPAPPAPPKAAVEVRDLKN